MHRNLRVPPLLAATRNKDPERPKINNLKIQDSFINLKRCCGAEQCQCQGHLRRAGGLEPRFDPQSQRHFRSRQGQTQCARSSAKTGSLGDGPSGSLSSAPGPPPPRMPRRGRVRERPAWATDCSVRVCACLCAPGKETELPDKVSRFQSKAPVKHEADVSK